MALFFYNLKGITRLLLPRSFFKASLSHKIDSIFKEFDDKALESIAERVAYYHKINTPFHLYKPAAQSANKTRLGVFEPHFSALRYNNALSLRKKYATGYWYDSFQYTRYFDDTLVWCCEFGDVNWYFPQPTISKTRPIQSTPKANADNSILLKLNAIRHFTFVKDKLQFKDKKDMLVFRGACYWDSRREFLQKYFSHPKCDIAHTGNPQVNSEFVKPKMSKQAHFDYKFILSLEGNDVASNLKWIMNSNSLCIMPKPLYESWFMEAKLVAGVHYAKLNDDYSNLNELLEYYKSHENEAEDIIHNAHLFCEQFKNQKIEDVCNLLVLRKYFYLSGQIDITPNERVLLKL